MKPIGLMSLAFAVALTVGCGRGDVQKDSTTIGDNSNAAAVGTSGEADRGTKQFVQDLTEAGTAEVQLGQLATQRATAPDVKQFGQMMIQDHTKAGEELKLIAMTYNIPPETTLSEKHRELTDRLSKLRGAEFDREYINAMIDGHQEVIDKLQSRVDEKNRVGVATGQSAKDKNVKPEPADSHVDASLNQWAADTLPVAKQHLEKANSIKDKLDAGKNTTARR
jgi:putative membrane protein